MLEKQMSLMERYNIGVAVVKRCAEEKHLTGVVRRLAAENFGGLNCTEQELYHHKQLAERFSPEQVERLQKAGMSWHATTVVLCFLPSPWQKARAAGDAKLANRFALRERQLEVFLQEHEAGLRGQEFDDAVRRWRADHVGLWSEGQRRQLAEIHKRALLRHMQDVAAEVAKQDGRLKKVEGAGTGLDEEQSVQLAALQETITKSLQGLGSKSA